MAVNPPDFNRTGAWARLFPQALRLMGALERQVGAVPWTFGGGTVLMLRIGHRQSRDIDLFVPDPQYLGHVNPRLSEVAESISTEYEEGAEFIKLFLPDGEIDIVAGATLTQEPFELICHEGHGIRVESCAEIVAKKMWHRGDRARARDLFDLCAVADAEPDSIVQASPFLSRHGAAFLARMSRRAPLMQREFEAIDALGFRKSFAECMQQAEDILRSIGTAPCAD